MKQTELEPKLTLDKRVLVKATSFGLRNRHQVRGGEAHLLELDQHQINQLGLQVGAAREQPKARVVDAFFRSGACPAKPSITMLMSDHSEIRGRVQPSG